MAVKDHIHLWTATPLASYKWTVNFEKQIPYQPELVIGAQRAMSGKLNVSVLSDTSGPVVFKPYRGIKLVIHEDDTLGLDDLVSLFGKTVKFVPNDHTDSGEEPDSGDVLTMKLVRIRGIAAINSAHEYLFPVIDLEDTTTKAVWTP